MLSLKIKKLHPNAVIPKFATEGSAGMDLTAVDCSVELCCRSHRILDLGLTKLTYRTGLAFEIPVGHVGLIFPRSSIHKTSMSLSNCVGVIDSDYRGEVSFVFRKRDSEEPDYQIGDRVGQLVIMKLPEIEVVEVDELSDTVRGTGGFGSTGK